jgi:hypothetical protein
MVKGEKLQQVLKRLGETDYELRPHCDSIWITVNNISVYIKRNDEGVSVDLYPLGLEMNDALASTWLTFAEAEPERE